MFRFAELHHVTGGELRAVWPSLRQGMDLAAKAAGFSWIPEEAFAMIARGQMALHVFVVEGEYAGFVVTQKRSAFDGEEMNIFALYVRPGFGDCIDNNFQQLERLAVDNKCSRLTFLAKRKGWSRRSKRLGFSERFVIYGKDLA